MYNVSLSLIRKIKNNIQGAFTYVEPIKYFSKDEYQRINLSNRLDFPNTEKILDLTSDNQKALVEFSNTFFTFLFQELPIVMLFYSRIKNRNIKLYINFTKNNIQKNESLEHFAIHYLKSLNINFEVIDISNYEMLKINNTYIFSWGFNPFSVNLLYLKTRKFIKEINKKPFRKVFVARKSLLQKRIDEPDKLAEYFLSLGFEIVYPEDFSNFIDQINYFNECKVIAGLSGSGLSNCVFMQQGGVVIEISGLFSAGDPEYPLEIHDFYRIMALYRGHLYFSVSNISKKIEDFVRSDKTIKLIEML